MVSLPRMERQLQREGVMKSGRLHEIDVSGFTIQRFATTGVGIFGFAKFFG